MFIFVLRRIKCFLSFINRPFNSFNLRSFSQSRWRQCTIFTAGEFLNFILVAISNSGLGSFWSLGLSGLRWNRSGEAEVTNFNLALIINEYISWLEISMHDVGGMQKV